MSQLVARISSGQVASPERLSPDWAYSTDSNYHVCKDLDWYDIYTPFTSVTGDPKNKDHPGPKLVVDGVGTVILPAERHPMHAGSSQLVLHNVLHVPHAACNIFAKTDDYPNISISSAMKGAKGTIHDARGEAIAFLDPGKVGLQIKLSKGSSHRVIGKSTMTKEKLGEIDVKWGKDETGRWEKEMATGAADAQRMTGAKLDEYKVKYRKEHADD